MKKKAIALGVLAGFLAIEAEAASTQMEVTSVQPLYKTVTRYENVPYTETVCYRYQQNSRGLLEKVVDNGFGSQEGMVGTAIGYGIGNEIGGGSGNEIAKVVGALIGNRIGNNINERKNVDHRTCEDVTKYQRQSFQESVVDGYNVSGTVNGLPVTVKRNYQPVVGDTITVNVRVW
jgi:uncharacterized protein YcfJ